MIKISYEQNSTIALIKKKVRVPKFLKNKKIKLKQNFKLDLLL